jgi:hypothetical protein
MMASVAMELLYPFSLAVFPEYRGWEVLLEMLWRGTLRVENCVGLVIYGVYIQENDAHCVSRPCSRFLL